MTLIEAMQQYNLRVECPPRWLIYNDDADFVVYEHPAYARRVRMVCRTNSEAIAIAALLNDEDEDV